MSIAVIGAGISGLACAHRLIELGVSDIHVLESASATGGLCRTIERDGFRYDLGPHQLHTADTAIVSLLEDLLGDDLITCPRLAGIRMHGKLLNYPLGISDLVRGLPVSTALASALDFAKAKLRSSPPASSFKDWVISNYGEVLYRLYFEPYTRKVWGCDPSELSTACAEERLASQSLWDVIMSAFNSTRHQHSYLTHSPYNPSFFYPKLGVGQLTDNWTAKLKKMGVTFHLNARIKAIDCTDSIFQLTTSDSSSTFDKVISTIPITLLAAALKEGGHESVPDRQMDYKSMVFTMLSLRTRNIPEYHWIYYPEPSSSFLRITQFQTISPAMAPAGSSSICAETTCDHGDAVWNSSDETIASQSVDDLCADGLITADDVTATLVHRERYAYPFMRRNYEAQLRDLLDFVDTVPNLYTTGRQGAFKYLDVCDLIPVAFAEAESACAH